MFRVRADFLGEVEVAAGPERARRFYADAQSFARLMPGVESVREESRGRALWRVGAVVALVGVMRGEFLLALADDSPARVEWAPAPEEKKNLLRYAFGFEETDPKRTLVRFAMRVELRRERASDLHLMAGLVGAARISDGVRERLDGMCKTYLARSRESLEGA